jgi:hypothetical protein
MIAQKRIPQNRNIIKEVNNPSVIEVSPVKYIININNTAVGIPQPITPRHK